MDEDKRLRDLRFGKIERSASLDSIGSRLIQSATLHNGNETDVKTRFEIRVRVENEKDVLTEFVKFRNETQDMAKAEFRIEHTALGNQQGFFYVVKCWTEVQK